MHPSSSAARTTRFRGRARPAVLLAALVAVGTSSCSLLPFAAGTDASTQTLADGSSFLVAAPTNVEDAAIVSGRLALIGGSRVGLEQSGGGETSTLAFPHGTHPSDDDRSIVLPDGVQITLGDSIFGGGGSSTLEPGTTAFDPWPGDPSGCAGATYLSTIYDVSIGEAPRA